MFSAYNVKTKADVAKAVVPNSYKSAATTQVESESFTKNLISPIPVRSFNLWFERRGWTKFQMLMCKKKMKAHCTVI